MKSLTKPATPNIDPILSRHLSQFGSKGGNISRNNLTQKQRSKAATFAVKARWSEQGNIKNEIPRRTYG